MSGTKIRIITIGAATQDVFANGKALAAKIDVRTHSYVEQFPLGAKLELDGVHFDTGGGASNAAITFARQGFDVGFIGKIGHDPAGAEVLRVLKRDHVDIRQVMVDKEESTGYSIILVAPSGERSVLAHRGASHNLKVGDFAGVPLDADWVYISSLAGNLGLLKRLLQYCRKHNIRVAVNPGSGELADTRKFKALIPDIDVLMGNREELQRLFGGEDPVDTVLAGMPYVPYLVLSDGPNGSFASDGQAIWHAGQYQKVKVIDRTGAGDAFCSGFVAAIAGGGSMVDALTLGSANSTSVVQKLGAKAGILHRGQLKAMKVERVGL